MNHVRFSLSALFSSIALCVLLCNSALSQSDNTQISGYVRDSTGSGVPNAAVSIKNESTGLERRAKTNETGYYVVNALPPGLYTLTAEASGFKKFQKTQNKLDPNIAATVDANLEIGAITETVDVVASATTLQTESATLGKVVTTKELETLQLNGRNPIFLALLKPGVRGANSLANFSFDLTNGSFNVNGARDRDTLITYDGAVGIRTRANGTSIGVADLDSVQEVQVLTANYNAEYGRSSGGQIRVVSKSGSSAFHGAAYEYFRNSALDANTWVRNRSASTSSVAPFRFNQYGYNVSGPVYIPNKFNRDKSKLFFLFSQEFIKRRRDVTQTGTVPTEPMRRGDFSALLPGTVIKDPNTGDPFPGNIIPTSRLSPNGTGLLKAFPLPTPGFQQGSANWLGALAAPTNQRKETYSADILPTEKNSIRFRFQNFHYNDVNPFQSNFNLFSRFFDRPNETASVNWIASISPTMVNEFLVTASRDKVRIFVNTDSPLFDRGQYGINFPFLFPGTKNLPTKIPTVALGAPYTELSGSPYPSSSAGPIYNISNNTTKIVNNHTIKFGVAFERAGQNDFDQINVTGVPGGTDNQNGRFAFSNTRTGGATSGFAVANAALGLFDTYAEIGTRSYTPYRGHMWEWFVQDSWKVTPKLRIEYGLRHSIIQPYYSLWRNMTVFDPRAYDPAKAVQVDRNGNPVPGSGDPYNGIVFPGSGFTDGAKGRVPVADSGAFNSKFSGPKQYSDIHFKDFQPRIGIAYSVTPKTVVRAGAGKFVSRIGVSDSVFLGGNPPLQPLASVALGVVDNPGGGSLSSFPLSVNSQDPIFQNPMAYTWNATVQREIGFNSTIEVSYVGRRGLRGPRERDINQPAAGAIQRNPGFNINQLRPYKGYGQIRLTNNEANSLYNGLQFNVSRRFSKGLMYSFAYTWSKSLDDGSSQRDILPNSYDAHNLWGVSDFDSRHVAVITFVYDLPIFKDRSTFSGKVLGGWEISGVTQFQSGRPYSVGTADDFAGVGGTGRFDGNSVQNLQMWERFGDARLQKNFAAAPSDPSFWFQTTNPDGTAIFRRPVAGTFTDQRNRNIIYGPGFQNWNIGMFKNFYVKENAYFTFRAESFNWINHPNLGGNNGNDSNAGRLDVTPTSATFGKVTGKGGERNLQLSLRFTF
jgi:hypothetical protein